jgi:hypothetical protein
LQLSNSLSSANRPRATFTAHTSTLQRQQQVKELCVDALNPIDPNFAYMLIYTNCNNIQTHLHSSKITNKLTVSSIFSNKSYDCIKVQFVLKSIEELLNKCPREFLVAVTTTCLNNGSTCIQPGLSASKNVVFSVYNEKLLDLVIRHLKSIYGSNFFSNSSFDLTKLNLNLNSTTYIEALTLVLLFYIRSYYPPSRFVLTTANASQSQLNTDKLLLNIKKSVSAASLQSTTLSQPSSSNNSSMAIEQQPEGLSDEELFSENRNVQIFALRVLTKLIRELINQSKSMPKLNNNPTNYLANSLVWYQSISDLLEKTKLQKTLLHCFHSTIFTPVANTLSQCILSQATNKQTQFTYVCELMNAIEHLIELEKILSDYQLIVKYQKVGNALSGNNIVTGQSSSTLRSTQSKLFISCSALTIS